MVLSVKSNVIISSECMRGNLENEECIGGGGGDSGACNGVVHCCMVVHISCTWRLYIAVVNSTQCMMLTGLEGG